MKKVLIISYYWPPAGGSGVQRWLKFSKYLPSYGWKPFIYTPKNPYFEIKDVDLLKDIPNEAEIWNYPIWEPYAIKEKLFGNDRKSQSAGVIDTKKSLKNRFLNWIRGNFFIPDPKVYWIKPSIRFLLSKIKKNGIEHVITTGPPHSMHLIGLGLKDKDPHLKWIADFRDPWSEVDLLNEFHLSSFSYKKHKKLERKVLEKADIVLTVSETWKNDLKRLGGKNVKLVTNGFDADDFQKTPRDNQKFIIGHYGLLNHLRNPKNLWKVLDNLCKDNADFNNKLELHLSGNIDSDVLDEIKSYSYIGSKIKHLGYLSHKKVLKEYNNASVLLLLLFNSKSGAGNYPAKIFEYLAAKRGILAFGPKNSDVKNLIHKTKSGIYFSYDEIDLKSKLLEFFKISKKINSEYIDCFSRKKLTKDLSSLLNKL